MFDIAHVARQKEQKGNGNGNGLEVDAIFDLKMVFGKTRGQKTREIDKKTCFRSKSDLVHSIFEQSLCSLHRKFAPFMVNLQIKKSHRLGQVRFLEMLVALFPISSKKGAFFQVS